MYKNTNRKVLMQNPFWQFCFIRGTFTVLYIVERIKPFFPMRVKYYIPVLQIWKQKQMNQLTQGHKRQLVLEQGFKVRNSVASPCHCLCLEQ